MIEQPNINYANIGVLTPYLDYRNRLGHEEYDSRLDAQKRMLYEEEDNIMHRLKVTQVAKWALKLSGLAFLGRKNFLNIHTNHEDWKFNNLPKAFDGFRILQMSDLHIDILPELASKIIEKVDSVEYDMIVLTGDYHDNVQRPLQECLELLDILLLHLQKKNLPILAILGNHDAIEIATLLELRNIKVLLNESTPIKKDGDELWFAGVDDFHFFKSYNIRRAVQQIPENSFKIILAHSPATFKESAQEGFSLQLSGHTHGGQICLPNYKPIIRVIQESPRRIDQGKWKCRQLQGYTSRGTGGCGVAARFFCPPEITVHTLKVLPNTKA